jgi:hypothetical protein
MADSARCGQCGEPIAGEPPGIERVQRKPCPKCNSTTRTFSDSVHEEASSSVTAQATIITYPQKLLTLARRLIDDGEASVAVVVAHMACEIATERSLTEAFVNKGIPHLEDSVTDFLNGYNLANERLRKFYAALTGDEVQTATFWQGFKESVTRRNKIVHSAHIVTKAEAEASYTAATDLVSHLRK